MLPDSPGNLPTHGKPVAGIAADLILVPSPSNGFRIGAVTEQRQEVVGISDDLPLTFLAPAPPGQHQYPFVLR